MEETTTWYRAAWSRIEPVEVLGHSRHQILLLERHTHYRTGEALPPTQHRVARMKSQCAYFPTWKEAHQHLMQEVEAKLTAARRNLELAQARYGNVKGMKPPKEPTP